MSPEKAWLRQSVQDFFTNFNWSGSPVTVHTQVENDHAPQSSLNLTLTVAEFFQAMNWEGIPQVGVVPSANSSSVSTETSDLDVTIEDLMGLF